jgi:hypothetical protein
MKTCPHCKETIYSFRELTKMRGNPQGRPIKCDQTRAKKLSNDGFSLRQISEKLGVSKGAVQYALRAKK